MFLRVALPILLASTLDQLQAAEFPGNQSIWNGYFRYDFDFAGRAATVVAPKQAAPGKPWLWRGEFFGAFPNADIALLARGFHVVYLKDPNQFGSRATVERWNAFYSELSGRYGFSRRPALLGMSRGGLYCYAWAAANPDKVACIYGDAPVCDIKSWPGGKGAGKGSVRDWTLAKEVFGLATDADALAWKGNPVDNLEPLAKAKIPILHVYGEADDVVPPAENTLVLADRYKRLGGKITLIAKPEVGHHPHGLNDPAPIVDFICQHCGINKE